MKVRIGVSAGVGAAEVAKLAELADALFEHGFDSLWLPEILTAEVVDPLVGLAYVAGHHQELKLGTTMVLPGRHLLRLAKALASLDRLSGGRLLLTFVPGLAAGAEREAVGVPPPRRGALMEEAMVLLRRLWEGEAVEHHGELGSFASVSIRPLPVQEPLEAWGGGLLRSSLERCGRVFDGWLPSFLTPEEAGRGRRVVEEAAEEAGRSISEEHYGASILYCASQPPGLAEALAPRLRGRPLDQVVATSLPALRELLEAFLAVGFSKFVVRPLEPPADWRRELEALTEAVGDLQS